MFCTQAENHRSMRESLNYGSVWRAEFTITPEVCAEMQSRTTRRSSAGVSTLKTPAFLSLTVFLYLLSVAVDFASCSSVSVQASDVAQASLGTYNLKEVDEIVYNVEIGSVPLPEQQSSVGEKSKTDSVSINIKLEEAVGERSEANGRRDVENERSELILLSKYGQKYLCTLPQDVASVEPAANDSENGTQDQLINMTSLLQPLTKRKCLTRNTGWWTYEYCHEDYVRQYRFEAGETVKNIWIGRYQNETIWDENQIKRTKEHVESLRGKVPDFRVHHSVDYVNGTTCDLTGKPRRATVELHCSLSGEDRLVSVQERETCDYVLTVETPLLCLLPLFEVKSMKKPRDLSCSPVISEEDYQRYTERQERKRREEEQRLKEEREKAAARKASKEMKYDDDMPLLNRLKSSLFDSGEEEEEESDEGEGGGDTETVLRDLADMFDKDVLNDVLDSLNSQLSELAKEKDNVFKVALEQAFKRTQKTVASLMKRKDRKAADIESLGAEKTKKDNKDSSSSEQTSSQEQVQTGDDGLTQKVDHMMHDRLPSDGYTVDREATVDRREENERDLREAVGDRIKRDHREAVGDRIKRDPREATVNRRKEKERDAATVEGLTKSIKSFTDANKLGKSEAGGRDEGESDRDDLEVEDEDGNVEEEEEEGESRVVRLSEEFKRKLGDAPSGNEAEFRVKVFTVSSDMLSKLLGEDEDEELDEDEGEEGDVDAYGNSKLWTELNPRSSRNYPAGSRVRVSGSSSSKSKNSAESRGGRRSDGKGKDRDSEVKVITVTLDSLFNLNDDSEDESSTKSSSSQTARLSTVFDQLMNPMTEERKRVQEMEANYEQVWNDGEETDKRKRL